MIGQIFAYRNLHKIHGDGLLVISKYLWRFLEESRPEAPSRARTQVRGIYALPYEDKITFHPISTIKKGFPDPDSL